MASLNLVRSFCLTILIVVSTISSSTVNAAQGGVRIKDLGRIQGVRDNSLVGYGIVTGLAGTGDSSRNQATLQSISNVLREFGVMVPVEQLRSRNVAAVMVTATLPPFARKGDKLDVNVSSVGDAKSLMGGTLLLTSLQGADRKVHALVQGQLAVGGYKYDLNGNVVQKNHPTSGTIPEGAIVESEAMGRVLEEGGELSILLFSPDFTTANRMAEAINKEYSDSPAKANDAGRIRVRVSDKEQRNLVAYVSHVENIFVAPDQRARVVVNERTGTVVSGGDVRISQVSITHGDMRVTVVTDYTVSQPGLLIRPSEAIGTRVVPKTRINVDEKDTSSLSLPSGTSVGELVTALNKVKASTRDIISILQSIRRAGALHAELVIQ